MKSDEFLKAVDLLEKEKHIDRDVIFEAMELALSSAYKRIDPSKNCKVIINRDTGEIRMFSFKTIVEELEDEEKEILLKDAKKINKDLLVGEEVLGEEITPQDFGRVAAATAKQVVVQKIREAERASIVSEFEDKEGELVTGIVTLEDVDNYYIDLGRTNGILPKKELIPGEEIKMNASIKVYVTKVDTNPKGTVILLSRANYNFVKRLFELEIPELHDGSVMVYAVARDPGVRSKVAVYSEYANIDPIGCCIGERGSRISNIIKELNGEKLDVVKYDEDKENFIKNALSPAKNLHVFILDPKKQEALVITDGEDFSLALGKKGNNVRLASRLTKFKIDVKNSEQAKEIGINLKSE